MHLTVLKSLDAVIQAYWFHQFPVNRSKKENYNCYRMSDKDFLKGCMFLSFALGSFIYYVSTFLGFLAPPPLRKHVFSIENKQQLAFLTPPLPPTSAYVIYEWSLLCWLS